MSLSKASALQNRKQVTCFHLIGLLAVFFLCLNETTCVENTLRCYQCDVERNELCTDEYLKPCSNDQAYDTCMTTVSFSKERGFWIKKRCALGPCNLLDHKQSSGLGLDDNCDQSKAEYTCVGCCRKDACNTADSSRVVSSITLVSVTSFIALSMSLIWCQTF